MKQSESEIEQLKANVEEKVGRPLKSPIDFDLLSYKVNEQIHEQISVSTIKRLWGYIQTQHTPRYSTLSTLARYVGFSDWDGFCRFLQSKIQPESLFFTDKQILSTDLCQGTMLEIRWNPDRRCVLKYNGNNRFLVIESHNAKLKNGDSFSASQFLLNHPLVITDLQQESSSAKDEIPVNYIAGYETGLTKLILIENI
ncbi:MAG: hypothetical protein RSA53_06340 [Odoribacter sp.]